MSYILEALRRAESERERGQVPRLHSQDWPAQDGPDTPDSQAARRGRRLWLWGLPLAVLLGGATAWWFWAQPAAAPAPQPLPQQTSAGTSSVAARPVLPSPRVEAATGSASGPEGALPLPSALPPALPPAALPPVARADGLNPAAAASAAAATAPAASLPSLAELSPALRAELPALQVGGAMHSPTPASRMLILNGQVFREGDQVAPGLRLEQIQLRSAVLNYKGQRLRLNY